MEVQRERVIPNSGASVDDAGDDLDGGDDGHGSACTVCVHCEEEGRAIGPAPHVEGDIDYANAPPAGGTHNSCWATWGAHLDEVRPENWVHNLEHGGVVFLYGCPEGCAAAIARLTTFADAHQRALLTPYRDLPTRFAYVSWGYRLMTDCDDPSAAQAFYETHLGHGLEDVASGPPVSCR